MTLDERAQNLLQQIETLEWVDQVCCVIEALRAVEGEALAEAIAEGVALDAVLAREAGLITLTLTEPEHALLYELLIDRQRTLERTPGASHATVVQGADLIRKLNDAATVQASIQTPEA
jgi:hypothetical protein